MRISDWSSDVCSSDLGEADGEHDDPARPGYHSHGRRHSYKRSAQPQQAKPERLGNMGSAFQPVRHETHVGRRARARKRRGRRLTLRPAPLADRSEEHTSELQSLMRISYAVFCLNKKKK